MTWDRPSPARTYESSLVQVSISGPARRPSAPALQLPFTSLGLDMLAVSRWGERLLRAAICSI